MEYIKRAALFIMFVFFISCGSTPGAIKNVEMSIEGMSCAHSCAPTIQEKLITLEGVKEARVDFNSKLALVSYDDGITNPETIKTAIESLAEGSYKVASTKEIAALPKDSVQ